MKNTRAAQLQPGDRVLFGLPGGSIGTVERANLTDAGKCLSVSITGQTAPYHPRSIGRLPAYDR